MAGLDTIRHIIEALRQSPDPPGIDRSQGFPRRTAGKVSLGGVNKDINYTKYVHQQHSVGESPVSYEEWMRGQ
jgi:hypothetical protein